MAQSDFIFDQVLHHLGQGLATRQGNVLRKGIQIGTKADAKVCAGHEISIMDQILKNG